MNSDNFVIYENEGKIMSGGYVINSQNIMSNLSGGRKKNKNEENDETIVKPVYAMPAGLIVIETNKTNNLPIMEINYSPKNVLDDDIFDVFYESAIVSDKSNDNIKSKKRITKKNIGNKHVRNKNNRKTKSNKKH